MPAITAELRHRVKQLVAEEASRAVNLRRDLHTHPEICYEEVRTSARIRAELDEAGIAHADGLAGGTGTIAFLRGRTDSAVGLRADIDGLPIVEETTFAWKSRTEGRMHACGHDGHTAILVGAARVLKRLGAEHELPNSVRFLFQPAEEGGAGGKRMVEDGALSARPEGPAVRRIYGLHNFPGLALGALSTRRGALFASSDRFEITVIGQAAHAAWPHHSRDPIVAASAIVLGLQSIVSRELDPVDAGGHQHHDVPCRHGDEPDRLGRAASGHHARAARVDPHAYRGPPRRSRLGHRARPPLHGPDALLPRLPGHAQRRRERGGVRAHRALGHRTLAHMEVPVMGGEDFAFYAERIPACFYILGVEDGTWRTANLHQPTFDFNDAAIPTGIEAMVALALADSADAA